jgi:endogenous inhibitor of DNA gyrase (YacG/DUF329 family)
VCRKRPVDPAHRPFCSQRCRLIDLGRWADGGYRVAGEAVSPDPDTVDDQTDES